MKKWLKILAVCVVSGLPMLSVAANKRTVVAYNQGGVDFESVLVQPAKTGKSPLPALLLVPNWMGIQEPNLKQAELIANMGYVVFVADLYGKTVRPKNSNEAGAAAGKVKGDRALMRDRMQRALAEFLNVSKTTKVKLQSNNVATLGFCFGGTAALELARSGANVKAAISFHGGIDSPTAYDAKVVKAKILVLHGADDPYVPAEHVKAFENEMRTGGLDWELVSYGGAVHSFTDVDAKMVGQAHYDAKVAKRAYARMQNFLTEAFAP